jgi:adenylate cyclase class 2
VIEQEVKLPFDSVEAARQSIQSAGGRLVVSRRLLDDRLYDTPEAHLRRAGCALRVRRDGSETVLTFKGAQQPGPVKSREEIETTMGDPAAAEAILSAIGFRQCFRSEKYREDYEIDGVTVIVDDTPMGVFVEIEGMPDAIVRIAAAIGRSPADFELASYPGLYRRWCERHGRTPGDMVFENLEN